MTHIDPSPTGPNQISRVERDKLLDAYLERIHTTGPFHADEFTTDQRVDLKSIFKEALREWLDDMFSAFGRWAFISILAMVFAGLVYFALTIQGWHLGKSVAEASEATK